MQAAIVVEAASCGGLKEATAADHKDFSKVPAGQRSTPHELQHSRADTVHACLLQMPDGQPVAIKLYIGLIRAALSHSEGNNTVFGSRRFKRWENNDEALDKFMMVHETIIDWLNQVRCLLVSPRPRGQQRCASQHRAILRSSLFIAEEFQLLGTLYTTMRAEGPDLQADVNAAELLTSLRHKIILKGAHDLPVQAPLLLTVTAPAAATCRGTVELAVSSSCRAS